jgi:hypothetical protein
VSADACWVYLVGLVGKPLAEFDLLGSVVTSPPAEGVGSSAPERLPAIMPLLGDRSDVCAVYQPYRDALSSIGLPYVVSEQAWTAFRSSSSDRSTRLQSLPSTDGSKHIRLSES